MMTADVKLLPLPEGDAIGWSQAWSHDQMRDYARANVLHHLQSRAQRLAEALRAERRWWVDRKADAIREQVGGLTRGDPGAIARCDAAIQRIDAALAQQPAAVDDAMVERGLAEYRRMGFVYDESQGVRKILTAALAGQQGGES